jgi:anti-sigma regulatory factor (Ser/Thr protein kinase)
MSTNLVERPVLGSMVSRLPVSPQPHAAWVGRVQVSKNALEQARHETEWFLQRCRNTDPDLIATAVLIVSELVTNAYFAMTGYDSLAGQAPRGLIIFSLRIFDNRLLIEVTDTSPKVPVLDPPCDGCAESGRGLCIVEAVSDDWGFFFHRGQKVVFAILPIETDAEAC